MTRSQYLEARQALRLARHLRQLNWRDGKRHGKRNVDMGTVRAAEQWAARVDGETRHDRSTHWTIANDPRITVVYGGQWTMRAARREYQWLSREYINDRTNSGLELWCPITSDTNTRHPHCRGYMNIRGSSQHRWWKKYTRPTLRLP